MAATKARRALAADMLRTAKRSIALRIREVRKKRNAELKQIKASCKAQRKSITLRRRAEEADLRARYKQLREQARADCKSRHAEALRNATTTIEKERIKRRRQEEMKAISDQLEGRSPRMAKAFEARRESDDEVRRNLEPEMVAVFDKVKRGIKGDKFRTRTEAFLEWVHENPGEVAAMQADGADQELKKLIRQQEQIEAQLAKIPRGPGGFETLTAEQAKWLHGPRKTRSPIEEAAAALDADLPITADDRRTALYSIEDAIEATSKHATHLQPQEQKRYTAAMFKLRAKAKRALKAHEQREGGGVADAVPF